MLDNFNVLSSDPKLHRIFHEPLLVSYHHEQNLGDILILFLPMASMPDMRARNFSDFSTRADTTSMTSLLVSLRMLCIELLIVAEIGYTCTWRDWKTPTGTLQHFITLYLSIKCNPSWSFSTNSFWITTVSWFKLLSW